MIRLATVFSGIGAIEHALKRMGLEHKIVFACDNGDVEILTKNVGMNIDDIGEELNALKKTIKTIQIDDEIDDLYKNQLQFITRKNPLTENELITQIHEYCVYESFCKIGWLFTRALPQKPRIKFNRKQFLRVVRETQLK